MKRYQFILCFLLMLTTIHGITVYENSNLTKRSPKPYHSYIEFEDKRPDGGYGYKFQVEGNHTEQETHWKQPKYEQPNTDEDNSYLPNNYEQEQYTHYVSIPTVKQQFQPSNTEEDNSYFPSNYEQGQSYIHHAPIPLAKQPNVYINQEQQIENGPQPQITFESNLGAIRHDKENKVTFNNYLHGPNNNLQSFPNLFFPNHEHESPNSNASPIKLSQLPIVTKYVPVPVPVKYMPVPVKEPAAPSRGHIKFAPASINAAPSKTEPVIIMKPNIGMPPAALNVPVKYIMIPVQQSLDTKQIQYQPNPAHREQIFHKHTPTHIQHQHIYEEDAPNEQHQQIRHNIPVKYKVNKVKEDYKYTPQKLVKQVQSNNQFVYKYNQGSFKEDLQKNNEEYLPNRLAHPVVDKQIIQYVKHSNQESFKEDLQKHNVRVENYPQREYVPNRQAHPNVDKPIIQYVKHNHQQGFKENFGKNNEDNYRGEREYLPNRPQEQIIQYANTPQVEGQPMYEYKTIQEEDYKNSQPSVEYQMLNMPELLNKLPANSIELSQKFMPQNIPLYPQQNFKIPNNIPQGMNFASVNNPQAMVGGDQQFKQFSSAFGHDLMQNVNFNFGIKRRSIKGKDSLKSAQKKIKYSKELVENN